MGIGYWLIKKYFIILLIFNHGFLPRSKSRDSIIYRLKKIDEQIKNNFIIIKQESLKCQENILF